MKPAINLIGAVSRLADLREPLPQLIGPQRNNIDFLIFLFHYAFSIAQA